MEFTHKPVLLEECIEGLAIKPDGIYLDGTLGGGGHSMEIAKRLKTGRLIGIDRDKRAIERAGTRLREYRDKLTLVHGNFKDAAAILDDLGIEAVDGALFDLGVSSPQLDETERGFSYMTDAPLDMRMDESAALGAYDIVNNWEEAEIRRILFQYGEERYAAKIASRIVRRRNEKPIETTLELTEIIKSAMPAAALREKQHPAKRSFQGIRIAVNDELSAISEILLSIVPKLAVGGRLLIISFHSGEDKIVKSAMHMGEKGCTCPPDFPVCVCGFVPTLKLINRKPITASEKEIDENPRARSAKLRIAEKL